MNIDLKPIAESKVRQLGGEVCGVLVRNESGTIMAVSEDGRCTRLDAAVMGPVDLAGMSERYEFEKAMSGRAVLGWNDAEQEYMSVVTQKMWMAWQAARAQGAEPVGFVQAYDMDMLKKGQPARIFAVGNCPSPFESYQFVYTHPPAKPESVPSRDDLIQCLLATRGQSEGVTADAILSLFSATAPQPAQQGSVPDDWRDVVNRTAQALSIMDESEGITGWHLNGDVSPWDEGDLPALREELMALLTTPQEGE